MIFFKLFILFYLIRNSYLRCSSAYGEKPCPFVPSPPGERPPCSKPGITFCEYPEHYPKDVILHLIEKWRYDHSTLLTSESNHNLNNFYIDNHGSNLHRVPSDSYGPPNYYNSRNLTNYNYMNNQVPYRYPQFFKSNQNSQTYNEWQNWNEKYRSRTKRSNHRRWLVNLGNQTNGTLSRKKRQSGGSQSLCPSRSNYIVPRAALNNKGDWMYVVNVPEVDNRYTQLVKSETCISQQCSGLCNLPNGYTSRCEQKYVQKRLVALEAGGSQLYTDVFWFPSCCICTINN